MRQEKGTRNEMKASERQVRKREMPFTVKAWREKKKDGMRCEMPVERENERVKADCVLPHMSVNVSGKELERKGTTTSLN